VWAVKSVTGVVSASRVVASGRMDGSVAVSAAGERRFVMKGRAILS